MTINNLEAIKEAELLSGVPFIYRLWKRSLIKFPKDTANIPDDLFLPSTEDKGEAKLRKLRPLLSIWDSSLPDKSIRGVFDNINENDNIGVYILEVEKINLIFGGSDAFIKLSVYKDPLEPTKTYFNLHYVIQGACRSDSETGLIAKNHYKNMQFELREISKLNKIIN